MTINELLDVLRGLESKGHGKLPVYHLEDSERQIEGVELITDTPAPIAILY